MKRTFILSMLLWLFWQCADKAGKPPERDATAGSAEETAPPVDEDEVVMQLSAYLVAEPQSQAEKDQNEIVNYAIEHVIPLERTASGLFYQVIRPGQGELLKWGDKVSADYEGRFLDGRVFDSSYQRGKPIRFNIGQMVAGWNEGLQLLRPGGKILLLLPSTLGYGEQGFPDNKGGFLVPPHSVLMFDVEVMER